VQDYGGGAQLAVGLRGGLSAALSLPLYVRRNQQQDHPTQAPHLFTLSRVEFAAIFRFWEMCDGSGLQ